MFEENGREELSKTIQDLREDQVGKAAIFPVKKIEWTFSSLKYFVIFMYSKAEQKYVCFSILDIMLKFLCSWNTNAKHSHVSQTG